MAPPTLLGHAHVLADAALLAEVVDSVLLPSFTADETGTRHDFTQRVLNGVYTVTALVDDRAVVAAGVEELDPRSGIDLLAYLAVRAGLRGGGYGSALFEHLQRRWSQRGAFVVGELHDPAHWPCTATDDPEARFRFYARHGVERLALDWTQPPLSTATGPVPHMALAVMSRPGDAAHVPAGPLWQWADRYLVDSGAETCELRSVVDAFAATPTIAVRPLLP